MGCNCKINKQILNIHKKYGYRVNTPWKERISFKFKETVKALAIIIPMCLLSPFIFILFFFLFFRGKKVINVNKLIRKLIGKKKNE